MGFGVARTLGVREGAHQTRKQRQRHVLLRASRGEATKWYYERKSDPSEGHRMMALLAWSQMPVPSNLGGIDKTRVTRGLIGPNCSALIPSLTVHVRLSSPLGVSRQPHLSNGLPIDRQEQASLAWLTLVRAIRFHAEIVVQRWRRRRDPLGCAWDLMFSCGELTPKI